MAPADNANTIEAAITRTRETGMSLSPGGFWNHSLRIRADLHRRPASGTNAFGWTVRPERRPISCRDGPKSKGDAFRLRSLRSLRSTRTGLVLMTRPDEAAHR